MPKEIPIPTSKKTKKQKKPPTQEQLKRNLRKYLRGDVYKTYINKLKQIDVEEIKDPFNTLSSKDKPKLKTNTILDDLLGWDSGGICAGKLVEFYGGYGSGKSQTVFTLIAEATQEGSVIIIDSEYTWSPERQDQICDARGLDKKLMRKNFTIVQPKDYEEQLAKILTLPSPIDLEKQGKAPLKLIAVDSLVCLVDDSRDFRGRSKLPLRAGVIRDMLRSLRNTARLHNCVVVFTNQISTIPDIKPFMANYQKEKGTGGNVTRHKPDIVLYYRRAKDPIRVARLMDSSELPVGERVFRITEKGIENIDEATQKRYDSYKVKANDDEDKD